LPEMRPCSLAKAISDPVNVSAPKSTSKPTAPSHVLERAVVVDVVGYADQRDRETAKACDNAIRSGIFVIGFSRHDGADEAAEQDAPRCIVAHHVLVEHKHRITATASRWRLWRCHGARWPAN